MHFAVFIDDILGRKCIILKEELFKESTEHFEADSWEEALCRLEVTGGGCIPAFVCRPIHAAYLTYIDDIDILMTAGSDGTRLDPDGISLIYDPLAMKKRKMLNREIREDGYLKDIVAGDLIVIPDPDRLTYAYDIYGSGQVFIFDRRTDDIRTVRCSPMALSVLRENNISLIA